MRNRYSSGFFSQLSKNSKALIVMLLEHECEYVKMQACFVDFNDEGR